MFTALHHGNYPMAVCSPLACTHALQCCAATQNVQELMFSTLHVKPSLCNLTERQHNHYALTYMIPVFHRYPLERRGPSAYNHISPSQRHGHRCYLRHCHHHCHSGLLPSLQRDQGEPLGLAGRELLHLALESVIPT